MKGQEEACLEEVGRNGRLASQACGARFTDIVRGSPCPHVPKSLTSAKKRMLGRCLDTVERLREIAPG